MNTDKAPDNSRNAANQPDHPRDVNLGGEDIKSVPGDQGSLDRLISFIPKQVKDYWLWILAYSFNLVYFIFALINANQGSDARFTIPMFPGIIFICIIFVQIYADPIGPIPAEELDQKKERN